MLSSNLSSIYFESSWSILSSIGLVNVFIGILVIGITRPSPITFVPVVVSACSAIADGLCYVAFYQDVSTDTKAVASVFADLFWLIQETGLSMYNYQILIRILPNRQLRLFRIVYWFLILSIVSLKMPILCMRVEDIAAGNLAHSHLISRLHIGYFMGIALVEMWSSYFLLKKFLRAKAISAHMDAQAGLFTYLMRSTELRLAGLSVIGISRAITFSFQTTAQFAVNVIGQLDRFVYFLECIFPIVMFIDILAAKTVSNQNSSPRNDYKQGKPKRPSYGLQPQKTWPQDHSMVIERAHLEQWDEMSRHRSKNGSIPSRPSSQDRIIRSDNHLEDGPIHL